jgi:DsbC/DsbD-like thiol-disulfide interchange protein/thiol-disulfide isomerase/thioredoxin
MPALVRRCLLVLIALSFCLPGTLRAQKGPNGEEITQLALLADTAAVEGGKPFYLGFHFKIIEKWHTYWRFPGSAGFPLTVAEWRLPPGWKAEAIEFPLPVMAHDTYGQTFFAYEHEVLFPVKITPPAKLTAGDTKLGVKVKWQVCEQTCIPGNADLEITLPGGPAKPANEALFKEWLGQLPQTSEPPTKDVKFDFTDKKLTVRIAGLPKEVTAEFFPIPPPEFTGTFEIEQKPTIETAPDGTRIARFPFDSEIGWSGLLVTKASDGVRKGWYIGDPPEIQVERPASADTSVAAVDDGDTWDPFDDVAKGEAGQKQQSGGLWLLLLNGFLGGLLLNLMPCVLPVISLKIFGFVKQASESRERIFQLGLAFCAGVFAFFLLLALLVLGLSRFNQSLGWGAQFSNPIVLTVMIGIMFLFGLSLLGVFEVTLGGGTSSKLSELSGKEGRGGAFIHGFFTTLLGTSCTAPLVAPVLGAAINQPGPVIFALFGSVATGLALPYFLLTWKPAWMRFLPKPGTWMVRFKQILGFVMIAFAVWLMGSFPSSAMVVSVGYFLLVLAVAAWLYGAYHDRWWPTVTGIALIAAGWWFFIHGTVQRPPAQSSGLVSNVRAALKEGRPVFVDFTADWCLNCKTYEKLVLDTQPIQDAFKAKNVHFVKADYTAQPPDIEAALKKMGRVGVPAYILFRKRGDYWIADGLTTGTLLEELNKL